MTHKADQRFFEAKRHWSQRKDEILGCYLRAYLPKIATQRLPVLIVDGFAGPGKFDDGRAGSPLIIAQVIRQTLAANLRNPVPMRLLCIERDEELFRRLTSLMEQFDFAQTRCGSFGDHLDEIAKLTADHSVFLYVDPFTVEGLNWAELDRLFTVLSKGRSLELLLNFNGFSFVRRGLAALKLDVNRIADAAEDHENIDAVSDAPPDLGTLDSVVGGDWWRSIVSDAPNAAAAIERVESEVCARLRKRFNEVCRHPLKAMPHHTVPKYSLIFGSRHPAALCLMNDEMVKSVRVLAELAAPSDPMLFETRPEELVPDARSLPSLVLAEATQRMPRSTLITKVVRQNFCRFTTSDIRGAIESLLKAGELVSATGKWRINGSVDVWRPAHSQPNQRGS